MKRYISMVDENNYTHMLKVLKSIGGRKLDYNWYITDIEAYPQDEECNLENLWDDKEYLFLSNDELINMLEKNDFIWVWGCFFAIPKKYSLEEIQKYESPFCDGNSEIHGDKPIIQHPLAEIEIDAEDSSNVTIVSKDDNIADMFKKVFKNSEERYWFHKNYYGTEKWNAFVNEKELLFDKYKNNVELSQQKIDEDYIIEHNVFTDSNKRYIGDRCKLINNEKIIFEWTYYYGKAQLHRVIKHKNGKKYLIYNEDLYGYSVFELDSKEHINYLPFESYMDESRFIDTFIFCDAFYNSYNDRIAIEGCIWAAPYSIITFDFKNPLEIKTIDEWKDIQNINTKEYYNVDFVKWDKDKLIIKKEGKNETVNI